MKARPWRLWPAVGVLALLVHGGAWWWAERSLAGSYAAWVEAMRARGVAVGAASAHRGGWPLAASLTLAELQVRAGDLELSATSAVLELSPLHPDALRIRLPGTVSVQGPGLPPTTLQAASWSADVPFSQPPAMAMQAIALRVELPAQGGGSRDVTAATARLQARSLADGMELSGSAQSIGLPPPPPGEVLALGPRLPSLAFQAIWHAADPGSAVLAPRPGDTLEIGHLALGYGPLGLSGQGRFVLAEHGWPAGEAALRIVGYAETLQALEAGRVMTHHAALAASAVLALLARPPEGGGAAEVQTTLVVRDGVLSVAGFPLLRLPASLR